MLSIFLFFYKYNSIGDTMNESVYKTHELKLLNRNILSLNGINKVLNFDKEEFVLSSSMGNILVKGKNLEMLMLDTEKGDIKIKGDIFSIVYIDSKKKEKESILTKLFK